MAYQWEADEKALVCVYNKPKEPVHGSDLLGIDLTLLSLGIMLYVTHSKSLPILKITVIAVKKGQTVTWSGSYCD